MAKKNEAPGALAKTAIVIGALAVGPALYALSYVTDDSAVRAEAKAARLAAQDEKNRQTMYEELNRRLGNH